MSVPTEKTHGLATWFESPLGKIQLQKEAELILQGVRRFHGDSMLWLGPIPMPSVQLDRCMVRHRVFGSLEARKHWPVEAGSNTSTFQGAVEALPFVPSSLDAVVLHHALDCCSDPRSAMREVCKVLRPGGRVLVCGFNPLSLWGLRRLAARFRRDEFSDLRFVSPVRLLDWMAVLGIEADEGVQYLLFRPPFMMGNYDARMWQRFRAALQRARLPVGGVYYVLGRKSAAGVTPLRNVRALARGGLSATVVPRPVARTRGE
jgi:SAM-dependent methyltransferase